MTKMGSNAAQRLLAREAHGMQLRLTEDELLLSTTNGLEDLAKFLGLTITAPIQEKAYRRAMILAIIKEERRLSRCRREERWLRKGV